MAIILNQITMKTVSPFDINTLSLIKQIYRLKDYNEISEKAFLRIYGRVKSHCRKIDTIQLQKEYNTLQHYLRFMQETYPEDQRKERNHLFKTLVLPSFEELYKAHSGTSFKVQFEAKA